MSNIITNWNIPLPPMLSYIEIMLQKWEQVSRNNACKNAKSHFIVLIKKKVSQKALRAPP